MPAFFPILETLLKRAFRYLANSYCSDFSFISSIAAKRFPFFGVFNFGKRKKSAMAKSVEYGAWGRIYSLRTTIDLCVSMVFSKKPAKKWLILIQVTSLRLFAATSTIELNCDSLSSFAFLLSFFENSVTILWYP